MPDVIDVLTIGESLGCVRTGQTLQPGAELRASIAGAESNVAIGLSRLGHPVCWAGVVGNDAFGDLVLRTLRSEGVQTATRRSAAATGLIVFLERLPGITTVDYLRNQSAGSTLAPADIDAAFESVPRVLHVSGITPALSPTARATVEHAMELAHEAGARICFDINYRSRLWTRDAARAVLAPLARLADIVIASDDELDLALGAPPEKSDDQVSALLEYADEVVVKHGAGGATGYVREERIHEPARSVPAVNTIGAGDAFVSGYLSATLDGLDLAARLARGSTLGAFAVCSSGDWEGLPTRAELPLLDLRTGTAVR